MKKKTKKIKNTTKKCPDCFSCNAKNRGQWFVWVGSKKLDLCSTCYFGLLGVAYNDFRSRYNL